MENKKTTNKIGDGIKTNNNMCQPKQINSTSFDLEDPLNSVKKIVLEPFLNSLFSEIGKRLVEAVPEFTDKAFALPQKIKHCDEEYKRFKQIMDDSKK